MIDETGTVEELEEPLTKEEHIENFIADLSTIEACMEPFKEHKRDLRASYIENDWLTKEEIWTAVKAYRLMTNKRNIEFDEIVEVHDVLKKSTKVKQ